MPTEAKVVKQETRNFTPIENFLEDNEIELILIAHRGNRDGWFSIQTEPSIAVEMKGFEHSKGTVSVSEFGADRALRKFISEISGREISLGTPDVEEIKELSCPKLYWDGILREKIEVKEEE